MKIEFNEHKKVMRVRILADTGSILTEFYEEATYLNLSQAKQLFKNLRLIIIKKWKITNCIETTEKIDLVLIQDKIIEENRQKWKK